MCILITPAYIFYNSLIHLHTTKPHTLSELATKAALLQTLIAISINIWGSFYALRYKTTLRDKRRLIVNLDYELLLSPELSLVLSFNRALHID
jgi:hypothetical protein